MIVLPVDAAASAWDCTLEGNAEGGHALRLGLRLVQGLSRAGAERLVCARVQAPFGGLEDLAHRSALSPSDLKCLAAAGALAGLVGHRRKAYWEVAAWESPLPLDMPMRPETQPQLLPPGEGENIVADYASFGLTLGRHPLALLREGLRVQRMATAAELQVFPHGRSVRAAGLVIGRQRPGTAAGVTFVTLEDETGQVNVVVWRDLAERQRRELLGARLLAVYGVLERRGRVAHLIAKRLRDMSALLGDLHTQSRDFR